MKKHALVLSLALLGAAQPQAPADHTQSFSAVKTQAAPPLDASLTSPAWNSALKAVMAENFSDRQPAKYSTVAYMLYDDKNLYVAFHAQQAGIPITATQTVDHAGVTNDDHVTFTLDTSGNGSRVYTFRANPKGVHDESSSENARYAPDWSSVATVLPNGDYNVMMVIPLANLRVNSGVQHWKMQVARLVAQTNDLFEWAYEPTQTDPKAPQYWPSIEGVSIASTAAKAKPHADVFSLAAGGADHNRFQNGFGPFERTRPRSLGVDITVPVTSTMNLVGTLNPDFSNVEHDQTTIAPQQFARNYSEYRPFFAQGARYINTLPSPSLNGIADTLFYSPSIGIFDRGVKLEGTAGHSSIGALNVSGAGFNDTAVGYGYMSAGQQLHLAAQGVFAKHPGVTDNAVGAAVQLTNPRSGVFTIAKTETDANSLTGSGHYIFASEGLNTATWFAALDYRDISANFNPIDGYTAFSGIRGPRLGLNYNGVGKKGGFIKSYAIGGYIDRFVDGSGHVNEYDENIGAYVLFQNQVSLQFNGGTSALRLSDSPADPLTRFNLTQITAGYKDGTPGPIDLSYAWGPFGGGFLQQITSSTSRSFGPYSLSLEYDGTIERGNGPRDSQWLRRLAFARSFGRNTTFALSLRDINGTGGYAAPGTNLSFLFHKRFNNGDEFYFDYGTPNANKTLHRVIAKYVFRLGSSDN